MDLDLATGQARERQLDDAPCEFPRIDDRRTGLPTAHAYVVTDHAVRRYELSTGATQTHDFGEGSPGEMTFVPRRPPDQQSSPESDTDGFLMGYVHRPSSRTSDLVVLDAANLATEPLAQVRLPTRVPDGFHGNWFAD